MCSYCIQFFAALSDIVINNVNGYCIPAFNENAFVKQLHHLMKMRMKGTGSHRIMPLHLTNLHLTKFLKGG